MEFSTSNKASSVDCGLLRHFNKLYPKSASSSIIPAHENFYGIDSASSKIWGASDDAFAGIIGDILIAQGSPGVLLRASWNGSEIEVGQIAEVSSWKQITFLLQREVTVSNDGTRTVTETVTVKRKYTQDWANYNKARTNERAHFLSFLYELCSGIEEPSADVRTPALAVV